MNWKIISKRVYKRLRSVNPKVICEPLCKKDTTNKKMQCVYHETTYTTSLCNKAQRTERVLHKLENSYSLFCAATCETVQCWILDCGHGVSDWVQGGRKTREDQISNYSSLHDCSDVMVCWLDIFIKMPRTGIAEPTRNKKLFTVSSRPDDPLAFRR